MSEAVAATGGQAMRRRLHLVGQVVGIASGLAVVAWAASSLRTVPAAPPVRWDDRDAGVICYSQGGSLSCVK
jgi:hypothetical protein